MEIPELAAVKGRPVRDTRAIRSSVSCTSDPELGETLSQFINAYQLSSLATGAKATPFVPIAPNACIILAAAPDLAPTGSLHLSLDEGVTLSFDM